MATRTEEVTTAHVLVVTGDYDHDVDEREFRIEHHGPVTYCRMWYPCAADQPCQNSPETFEPDTLVLVSHGIEHHWIEGDWAVPTDPARCAYTTDLPSARVADYATDLVFDDPNGSVNKVPLFEGRYLVRPTWLGEGDFALDVVARLDDTDGPTGPHGGNDCGYRCAVHRLALVPDLEEWELAGA